MLGVVEEGFGNGKVNSAFLRLLPVENRFESGHTVDDNNSVFRKEGGEDVDGVHALLPANRSE